MYDEDNSREVDTQEMENVMKSIYSMLEGAGVEMKGDPVLKARECFKQDFFNIYLIHISANVIFRRMDKSGDGKLSEDEFIKVILLLLEALFQFNCQGAMDDDELMLMLDSLFSSMTGTGFLSQAEKVVMEKKQ